MLTYGDKLARDLLSESERIQTPPLLVMEPPYDQSQRRVHGVWGERTDERGTMGFVYEPLVTWFKV